MSADLRTFIKVHDGMPDHPKIVGLSDAAFRDLVELWCYCSRQLTDGLVPAPVLRKGTTRKTLTELIDAGLLSVAPDGSGAMHDYLFHQRSRAQAQDLQEKRAAAGSKGGKSRASRQANASRVAKQTASKTQAEIEEEKELPEPDGSGASELVAEWIDHCPGRPPSRVVGQVAREVGSMLTEGIPMGDVRRGLAEWHRKGLHPSALASVVHEVRTTSGRRTGTTDQRVAEGLELAARLRTEEQSALPQIGAAS